MRWLRTAAIAAISLVTCRVADAQVLLTPEKLAANQQVKCGAFDNAASALTVLRDHYLAGRWDRLQTQTRELLDSCAFQAEASDANLFRSENGARRPNFTRDWYLVVVATVDSNDEPLILRYVVHDPPGYSYASNVLGVPAAGGDVPGAVDYLASTPRLIQVFLSPNPAITLQTRIQVTETANPLTDQIADAVKAVIDPGVVLPLLKGILSLPGGAAAAVRSAPEPVIAAADRVFMPFKRGDYKYSDTLRVRAVLDGDKILLLKEKFRDAKQTALAAAQAAKAGTAGAGEKLGESNMASALADAAVAHLNDTSSAAACFSGTFTDVCWSRLTEVLEQARARFCLDGANVAFCKTERDELMLIRFKGIATEPKSTGATAATTVKAVPYQRLSFGLVSAYLTSANSSQVRVKVDSGKVVADPIGRAFNSVVLNFHPRFNPLAPRMERGEHVRAFIGGVVTPNLGISVGAGYALLRNLSINGGYALLLIPTKRGEDTLDQPPSDGRKPFESGAAHTTFIGLGYKFGK